MTHGWRHTRWVNLKYVFRNVETVKTVGDEVNADRRHDDPQRVDLFTAIKRDIAKGKGSNNGEQCPYKVFP